MPPPPTRRRPVALEGRAQSRCVSIVKERETHVSLRTHGSHRGFGTRARTWITRFRVSCPADWTIPKKTTVGPAGVEPAPHGVRIRHAASTLRTERWDRKESNLLRAG